MDSDHSTRFVPTSVPHPGETVVDYLESYGWNQRDLARRTGLTPKTISEICNGKAPITPPTAIAFEKVFQRPAHLWLNLQRRYDEAEARKRDIAQTARWTDWAAKFPLREMKKLRWLPISASGGVEVHSLLQFLGVSSPESWQSVWNAADVAYRQTRRFKTSAEAVSVWTRATELFAGQLEVADFDEALLRRSIPRLRHLTRLRFDEIVETAQQLCAAVGIALVWVPELRQTGISGCARWMTDKMALIALTFRYKTDDQMWFTFFHELGHIILHKKRRAFILDNAEFDVLDKVVDPEMQRWEDEANRFSADTLIPPSELAKFIANNDFGSDAIHDFAEAIDIAPGVVVGRLQHDGLLKPYQGNTLKQRIGYKIEEDD